MLVHFWKRLNDLLCHDVILMERLSWEIYAFDFFVKLCRKRSLGGRA